MRIYNLFIALISLCFAFALAKEAKESKKAEEVDEKATEKVEEVVEETKKEREFPPKSYIEELHYGTRCPEADPKHPYEVNENFTRIDFHTNSVQLEINPTIETHNYTVSHTCSPYFYVRYTKGYRFAVTSYNFRGTYHIDKDVRAVVKSENTDAVTHVFEGPAMGTFDITDELDWSGWKRPIHGRFEDGKLWFGCGTDMIRISVGVEALLNNRLNEDGSGTLVLKDFSANIIWDKCPPEKKKRIPKEEKEKEKVDKESVPQPPKKPKEQVKKELKDKKTKQTKKIEDFKRKSDDTKPVKTNEKNKSDNK